MMADEESCDVTDYVHGICSGSFARPWSRNTSYPLTLKRRNSSTVIPSSRSPPSTPWASKHTRMHMHATLSATSCGLCCLGRQSGSDHPGLFSEKKSLAFNRLGALTFFLAA